MSVDLTKEPYYDRYDRDKKYTQLLAVPGRVAQAREITEIQSTMKDIIKSLGDSFMNDGDIIEGCQLIVYEDNGELIAKLTEGRIYMRGMVFSIIDESRTLENPENPDEPISNPKYWDNKTLISGEGEELIGIRLKETIVYSSDDPDLKDPAVGYANWDQPGCDRLKSEIEVIKVLDEDEEGVAVIARLLDGEIQVETIPEFDTITETLARRTYDESGSYIVDGLNVRVENNDADAHLFDIVVEAGKAYVHGYELTIPSSRILSVIRSEESGEVTQTFKFQKTREYYPLTTGPYVKTINSVRASKKVTAESVNVNNNSNITLKKTYVTTIKEVRNESGTVVNSSLYSLRQDIGGSSLLVWETNNVPTGDISIDYYYETDFAATNFELARTDDDDHVLVWKSTSYPVEGEPIKINFDKYLARKDTVYIDQDGKIEVITGDPANYGTEIAPDAPAYTLPLASIMSPPGGLVDATDNAMNIGVSNVGLTRFTMSDIHQIVRRLRTLEYDQTVISLNTVAKSTGSDDKRGIFTDPFIDLSKIGYNFNRKKNGTASNSRIPIFDTTLDLDSNMIYLPLVTTIVDMEHQAAEAQIQSLNAVGDIYHYNRVATLAKTGERTVLSQMKATKSFLVSPYLSYPQAPEIFISPSSDTWVDVNYLEVYENINKEKVVATSSRNVHTTSSNTIGSGSGTRNLTFTTTKSDTVTTSVGTQVEKVIEENVLKEEAVQYIRSKTIKVTGSNYPSNLPNIKCYFEGVKINLTGTGVNSDGSINADANGNFSASFTIPANKFKTGTRLVELKSATVVDGYKSTAFTYYQAKGTSKTIQRTISTIKTVLLERVTTVTTNTHTTTVHFEVPQPYDPDPLAQTFVLDTMTLLSGIDVYFQNVPKKKNVTVTCEIREVSNGNITANVLGFKTLKSQNISVSADGKSHVATRFAFNDPVLIEANTEYAFVLKSSSQDFRVWVAEIGEKDVKSKSLVLSNPYLLGVMMSSSNNSSWTVHQKADLKFRLISDNYAQKSIMQFKNVNVANKFCRLYLNEESVVFDGTNIVWEYSTDSGSTYKKITPMNVEVLDTLKDKIMLRATFTRDTRTKLSPVLAMDSVSFSLERYEVENNNYYYVSKQISGLDPYKDVEIILDTYEPNNNTTITVSVSPSNNNASSYIMKNATYDSSKTKSLNNGWQEKTYKATLDSNAQQCRIFIKLSSNNGAITPAFRRLRAIMS